MAANKNSSSFRRSGVLKNVTPVSNRDRIPRASSFNSKTHVPTIRSDLNGVLGNAMTVPPQKDKQTPREDNHRTKVTVPQDKEAQQLKTKEKDLLKQIAALKKIIEELQEQVRFKDKVIEDFKLKLPAQEKKLLALLNEEKQLHEDTHILLSVVQDEKTRLKSDIENLKKENQETILKMNAEWEEKVKSVAEVKDNEIKIRDEKVNRLKFQMADTLTGNSLERQQQLEELTKELARAQDESDILRVKLKNSKKNSHNGPCAKCDDYLKKLEKMTYAVEERDVKIEELSNSCARFAKQLKEGETRLHKNK